MELGLARILGLDAGIASIGWAMIEDAEHRIIAAGSWTFDAPENPKDRTSLNAARGEQRRQRRVIRRRRQRMQAVRTLLAAHGLLQSAGRDALRHVPALPSPWALRARALTTLLHPVEFGLALGHLARHRGFKSNSKQDRGANAADETSKMLKAMEGTRDRLAGRTFGSMMTEEVCRNGRFRNRAGDYQFTPQRPDIEDETRQIFRAQRRLGNTAATADLEARFAEMAFHQRPLKNSDDLVGPCQFEADERRTARRAPSFERFRFLSRLNHLGLQTGRVTRRLTADEIASAASTFGRTKGLTFKALRTLLDLDVNTRFTDALPAEEVRDVVARSGHAAEGTWTLRSVICEASGEAAWSELATEAVRLDRIAELVSFRDDIEQIAAGVTAIGLPSPIADAIIRAATEGRFNRFQGTGHVSAKAARAIIPGLSRGLVYSDACDEAGYDHAARRDLDLDSIGSKVTRKAVGEVLKQVRAIVRSHGEPDLIHVELARDLGKSPEERGKMTRGIEDRTARLARLASDFHELLGREPGSGELMRFELWKEQQHRCLYSGEPIPPEGLAASDARFQIDHILPWSRFGDDSFANKALVTAKANQNKRGRTPFEWLSADRPSSDWDEFRKRVEMCHEMKSRKKRGFYLRQNADEIADGFRSRNLNDASFAARVIMARLQTMYPGPEGERRIRARPGALTARLRQGWGLEHLKKGPDRKRLADDRHHALDAIVVAACSEATLQRLTQAFQIAEQQGLRQSFKGLGEPWSGFRDQVITAFNGVFVARAERARVPGALHEATVRQVRVREGKTLVYERKPIDALKETDLDLIKDLDRNHALRAVLLDWIRAGKPKDALPRSPKTDLAKPDNPPIRKVRLVATKERPTLMLARNDGSTVSHDKMARVDVFRVAGRYRLVPVYPHQVASDRTAPTHAAVQGKRSEEWPHVANEDFLFSLYQNSLLEITRRGRGPEMGYFKGFHINTASLTIAWAAKNSLVDPEVSIGSAMLTSLRKFRTDRLGNRSEVRSEVRTWHGVACT